MKRLNKTHIFHIFFGLLMFLPFISILSRVIYVQSNKNAKDSYSGNYEITYKYQSNEVDSLNDLVNGNIYEFYGGENGIEDICPNIDDKTTFEIITPLELNRLFIGGYNETLAPSTLGANLIVSLLNEEDVGFMIYLYFSYEDYNEDNYVSFDYNGVFMHNCIVKLIFNETSQFAQYGYTDYNEIESVNLTGTLDNVFDYSISKFIEDNNFKINFFSWFEDLFLVQNGGINALYLSFANWYMCYALLVSTGYLLFLILMWFINYVRKILEGGNSFGHGGF